jgi:hypothetical protein
MNKLPVLSIACLALAVSAASTAYAQASHPMADQLAEKVVQKYRTSSCADLARERQTPPSAKKAQMEGRAGQLLREDPQLRAAFVAKVAAPIADKMIVCGFIP